MPSAYGQQEKASSSILVPSSEQRLLAGCLPRLDPSQRVLVNLDVSNPYPKSISVDLKGDANVEVEVQYENIPCSKCLSAGHLTAKCPFAFKQGILRVPVPSFIETPSTARDEASIKVVDGEPGQFPVLP